MKSYKPLLKENDKEYILNKEGYEVVFKLFGDKGEREGRGFYYKKI